jgi:carboxyl-terminal processing protease
MNWIKIVVALLLLLQPQELFSAPADPYKPVNEGWERFGAVYARIVDNYYANMDQVEIMQAAIEGMLDKLDSYSQYYNEEGLRQLRQDTTGKFAGLGITVAIKDHYPVIISPIEDTPASRAGLQSGDLIVAIEGDNTQDMPLESIVDALRGDPGTEVRITVAQKVGGSSREVIIERQVIQIKSVSIVEEVRDGIGYISMRQTRFSEGTSEEVEQAIKDLKVGGIKGLVLDLRGNPGGLLSQATQVADLFLKKGAPIVSIRERAGRREEIKLSQRRPIAEELPLAVLIDEGSASASEIVAGAIQDNDRGLIIGTTSFGKGSVQTIFDLHEVAESALKLTTALYYTPSGRSIHREYSGGADLANRIRIGDRELPAALVLDIILEAADIEAASASLQARFEVEVGVAQKILSTRFSDLVGMESELAKGDDIIDQLKEKEEFFTQQGRQVYGGGGISPDIMVRSHTSSRYVQNLVRRRVFFDFVVDYVAADSTRRHEDLQVDEAMLRSFKEFVRDKNEADGYDMGRDQLQALKDMADELGWVEVESPLEGLGKAFEAEWRKGFTAKLEPDIRLGLQRELVLRFKGKKAQQLAELEDDPQLTEAVKFLKDKQIYEEALVRKD